MFAMKENVRRREEGFVGNQNAARVSVSPTRFLGSARLGLAWLGIISTKMLQKHVQVSSFLSYIASHLRVQARTHLNANYSTPPPPAPADSTLF